MLRAIKYSPLALATKQSYDIQAKDKKHADFWESEDKDVKALRSEIKDHYLLEQDFTCAYCQQRIVVEHHAAWDTEHIIPKITHPQFLFTPENLCLSCKDCNNEKRDKNVLKKPNRIRFPKKANDYIIYHPHLENFSDHIRLLPHSLFFIPKTEKGIKTIEMCGLLRFILQYGDYDVSDTQLKKEIALRNGLLQDATDPAETILIISEIEELMSKLKELARRAGIKKILDRKNSKIEITK